MKLLKPLDKLNKGNGGKWENLVKEQLKRDFKIKIGEKGEEEN